MVKKICVVLAVLALVLENFSVFAIEQVENKRDWMAQKFIANQIKGIGLVDSYQEDGENRSYVYDNSLAAIACMVEGNFGLAKEILDTLTAEVGMNPDGNVAYEYYDIYDGSGGQNPDVDVGQAGNSAWLLQALNIYQKLRSSKIYYNTQKKLADFLLGLQNSEDGGLRGGSKEDQYWKSTEHNIIAYAAIRNFGKLNKISSYVDKAKKIKAFLTSSSSNVWDGQRFNQGKKADGNIDTGEVVDAQALGALLLGNNYSRALTWAENNLKVHSRPYNSLTVTGFKFNQDSDKDTVWLEGTLQMALSFYKIKNTSNGDFYYNEAVKTIQSDGSVLLATDEWDNSPWPAKVWRSIAPTAWLVMYCRKFNPLILY